MKSPLNSKKLHFQRHQIKLNCWWCPTGAPGSERSMRSPSCVFTPWLELIFSWGLAGETSSESTALPDPAVVEKVPWGCGEDFLLEVRPPRSCWLYTSCCGLCNVFVMPSPSKSVSPWSTSGAIGGCSIGLAKVVMVHMESSRSGNEMMCRTMYANNWRTPSATSSHTPLMKNSAAAFRMAEMIVVVGCLFNVRCRIEEGSGHVSCRPALVIVCLHIEKQLIHLPYHLIQFKLNNICADVCSSHWEAMNSAPVSHAAIKLKRHLCTWMYFAYTLRSTKFHVHSTWYNHFGQDLCR